MPIRRIAVSTISLCLCLLLCSCTHNGLQVTDVEPAVTLPPAEVPFVAPIGDAALEYTRIMPLHLPSHDGIGLTTVQSLVTFSPVRPNAESLVRTLLGQSSSAEASALGGDVRLSLYGTTPVEISRDVVTINLSASALQLDREDLYIACQAIANTLTELDEIRYVNILVVDKPIGIDVANTLPMGSFQRSSVADLGAVYRQLLSRRVSSTESADHKPFSANVTLYFPLQDAEGLVSEVHAMSFDNQLPGDVVKAVLRQLSLGPADSSVHSPALPLLADLLTASPVIEVLPENGGHVLKLSFAHNLQDMLEAYGVTEEQCAASLCATFTTFLPQIDGIDIVVGDTPAESSLEDEEVSMAVNEPLLRSAVSPLLRDYCTLSFPAEDGSGLVSVLRPVSYAQTTHPRSLLYELSRGPQACDSRQDVLPVLNEKLPDTAMLGFALSDQTLLVNFAPAFSEWFTEIEPEEERMLAFSLVNTLCSHPHIQSVCFFQSGNQLESFSGEIYWAGLFYPLPEN